MPTLTTPSQITLLSLNLNSLFVLIYVLLYIVGSAVADHWPSFAFPFCSRSLVHTKVPELAVNYNAICIGKWSDGFVDYLIPAFIDYGNFVADLVSSTHSKTTWVPVLSSDGIGQKEISGSTLVFVSDNVETRYEIEFEKHDPDPCYRNMLKTPTVAKNVSLKCRIHSVGDVRVFVFGLEVLGMSHSEICFPADSHSHLPERILQLLPLEFGFDNSIGEKE